jgi:hypothetical protein
MPESPVAAHEALVSSIRSSRHEAERRSLLRKSAAARARQVDVASDSQEPEALPERPSEPALPAPSAYPSWRSTAARQAYLSTLPPPALESAPLVRLSHKA